MHNSSVRAAKHNELLRCHYFTTPNWNLPNLSPLTRNRISALQLFENISRTLHNPVSPTWQLKVCSDEVTPFSTHATRCVHHAKECCLQVSQFVKRHHIDLLDEGNGDLFQQDKEKKNDRLTENEQTTNCAIAKGERKPKLNEQAKNKWGLSLRYRM